MVKGQLEKKKVGQNGLLWKKKCRNSGNSMKKLSPRRSERGWDKEMEEKFQTTS